MAYIGRLDTGYTSSGAISPVGDADIFTTTYIAGLTYSVRVSGSYSGGGSLADPLLELQSASGTRLLFNDDIQPGVNRDAQLTFRVTQTTDYRLVVREMGDNATGSYTITNATGYASNADDTVTGSAANDAVNGMGGNDRLFGMNGSDRLYGAWGWDQLIGGNGYDLLDGATGNDSLWGGYGNDWLVGGEGTDLLVGGFGADTFVFQSKNDSLPGRADVISAGDGAIAMEGAGVAGGDVIDLSRMDANDLVAGNQSFTWGRGTGQIWLAETGGDTILRGNTDGDPAAEFDIVIRDGAITAYQYIGADFIL